MDTKKTCEKCVKYNECFKSINVARYVPEVQNCIDNGRGYFLPKEAPKFQFANGDKKTADEILSDVIKTNDYNQIKPAVIFFLLLGYAIRIEKHYKNGFEQAEYSTWKSYLPIMVFLQSEEEERTIKISVK